MDANFSGPQQKLDTIVFCNEIGVGDEVCTELKYNTVSAKPATCRVEVVGDNSGPFDVAGNCTSCSLCSVEVTEQVGNESVTRTVSGVGIDCNNILNGGVASTNGTCVSLEERFQYDYVRDFENAERSGRDATTTLLWFNLLVLFGGSLLISMDIA